jgi:hypothetical protein
VDALRAELLAFEAQAFNRGRMHRAWRDHRGAWAGAVAGAMRPAQLALSVAKLEEAMSTLRLTTAFARTRKAWYEALQRVVDRDADDDTEAAALNAINGRRGYCFCVEEDEGLCCEDMYSSRRRWRWNDDDEDALLTPLRMACAKQLAIVDRALQSLANATSDDETAAWSAGDAVFRFDEETQLTAVAQQQAGDDSAQQQQQQQQLVRGDANANDDDDDSTGSFTANPLADDPNRQYTSPSAVAARRSWIRQCERQRQRQRRCRRAAGGAGVAAHAGGRKQGARRCRWWQQQQQQQQRPGRACGWRRRAHGFAVKRKGERKQNGSHRITRAKGEFKCETVCRLIFFRRFDTGETEQAAGPKRSCATNGLRLHILTTGSL